MQEDKSITIKVTMNSGRIHKSAVDKKTLNENYGSINDIDRLIYLVLHKSDNERTVINTKQIESISIIK